MEQEACGAGDSGAVVRVMSAKTAPGPFGTLVIPSCQPADGMLEYAGDTEQKERY